jgi:hypothetical protein
LHTDVLNNSQPGRCRASRSSHLSMSFDRNTVIFEPPHFSTPKA